MNLILKYFNTIWYYIQFYIGKSFLFTIELFIKLFTGNKIFYDNVDFKWTEILESNYLLIRQEYLDVCNQNRLIDVTVFSQEQNKSVEPDKWSIFPLKIYGNFVDDNCKKCPETYNSLKQIPYCTTAWFSIMDPDTYVKPHRGTYKGYLRCLLGLIIPEDKNKTGLIIEGQEYHWENGKCVIFDDTFIHSAYNNSEISRVVLYIDFIRPMPYILVLTSRFVTYLISKSRYVKNFKF